MLSPRAEKIINDYFNLPFDGIVGVRCPYYINKRKNVRGQLRVLAGKGSPEEIVEESKIISIQYHLGFFENANLGSFSADTIRNFLIDQGLGVECSGFVTQILRAHYLETKKIDIIKKLVICPPDKLLRRIVCKLRPIENMDVRVYAEDKNSKPVDLANVQPGDFFIMLETGPLQKRNHIILIRNVENNKIEYVHSRSWSSDGKAGHGVSKGFILITDHAKNILDQTWTESEKTGDQNETWLEAKQAKTFSIRRLKI